MRDMISGALLCAFAVFLLLDSRSIRNPGFDVLGPAFLPQMVLWLILVLAVGLVVQAHIRRRANYDMEREPDIGQAIDRATLFRSAGVVFLLAAFIFSITSALAPFELLASVYMIATGTLLLPTGPNIRNVLLVTVVSVITAFVVGYVFKTLLYVNLP